MAHQYNECHSPIKNRTLGHQLDVKIPGMGKSTDSHTCLAFSSVHSILRQALSTNGKLVKIMVSDHAEFSFAIRHNHGRGNLL